MLLVIITELAASLMWLATVGMMIVKTPHSMVTFYRIQALANAAIAAIMAWQGQPLLWAAVGLAVAVRIILIPEIVGKSLRLPTSPYSAKSALGVGAMVILAFFLTAGGMLVAQTLGVSDPISAGLLFAASFVAFIHLSARYEVWSMLWALLSLDTIIDVGVLLFAKALPESSEFGLYAMSLALAIVLAFVAQRIQHIKQSQDVRDLEELIG